MDRKAGQGSLTASPIARVDVLGVGISAVDMPMAVAEISRWIEEGEQHYVCVTGVHGVMESRRDAGLRAIHNDSGLTTPDGVPMVWCARYAGMRHVKRVYGPDLMLELCGVAATRGWRMFFYGSKEGVPELLAERLRRRFPGLQIVGSFSPPFRPLSEEEDLEIVERINARRPHLVWVGLSTPKQERWMHDHVGRIRAPVLLGVGAAFDIHAGVVRQAPRWMQRSGLEWFYRLTREPRRLWRRYLGNNPRFIRAILARPPRVVDGVPGRSR